MGVLSDRDITSLLNSGVLGIDPFNSQSLTPNGYDLTIKEVFLGGQTISEGKAIVPSGTWFAVSTLEYVKLPDNVCAELWIRTTWARRGIISSFGLVDAGFEGELTLSSMNSGGAVEIPIGDRFAQMVFHLLSGRSEKTYEERSGSYQRQRGVTLAKDD